MGFYITELVRVESMAMRYCYTGTVPDGLQCLNGYFFFFF